MHLAEIAIPLAAADKNVPGAFAKVM